MENLIYHMKFLLWLIVSMTAGLICHAVIRRIFIALSSRNRSVLRESLIKHVSGPSRLIIPLLFTLPVVKFLPGDYAPSDPIRHAATVLLILSFGWLLMRLANVAEDVILGRFILTRQTTLLPGESRRSLKYSKK